MIFAMPDNDISRAMPDQNVPDKSVEDNSGGDESGAIDNDMFGKFTETDMFSDVPDGTNIPDGEVEKNSTMHESNPGTKNDDTDEKIGSLVLGIIIAVLAAVAIIIIIIIFIPKNDGNVNNTNKKK